MKKLLIALLLTCAIAPVASAIPLKVRIDQSQPEVIFFKWNVWFELKDVQIQIVLDPIFKDSLETAPKLRFNKALSNPAKIMQDNNVITLEFNVLNEWENLDFQIEWTGNAAYFTNVHALIKHSEGQTEGEWHLWSPNKIYH